ncbi:MAG TPA: hypothetical protein PL033_00930 [Candidatus Brocadiia bacterium]|nr:hypothetical protein [Candidatus Brocadiia bacterium]
MKGVSPYRSAMVFFTFAVIFSSCGCAGDRINLWPAVVHEEQIERVNGRHEPVRRTELIGPLVRFIDYPDRRLTVVAPLFNYERMKDGSSSRLQAVWPLLEWSRNSKGDGRIRLLPIIWAAKEKKKENEAPQRDHMIFPILFWGEKVPQQGRAVDGDEMRKAAIEASEGPADMDDEQRVKVFRNRYGKYWALFPIYGKLKRFLAMDQVTFILFPLYAYSIQNDNERTDVLWPIFTWGGNGAGIKTRRAWPIYIRKVYDGKYDQTYYAWPIVKLATEALDSEHPVKIVSVFPFYSQATSDVGYHRCYGYLVFRRRKDTRENLTSWEFVWPLCRFMTSTKEDDSRAIPLYWKHSLRIPDEGRHRERTIWAWPFVWKIRESEDSGGEFAGDYFVPIYWNMSTRRAEQQPDHRLTIFPLYTWRREPDGTISHYVASYGWTDATEGFKRNYRPLVDIFNFEKEPDGRVQATALWGFARRNRDINEDYFELAHVVKYREASGRKTCSFLFGLIRYDRDKDGWRWTMGHFLR